jgi:hypothetical protein
MIAVNFVVKELPSSGSIAVYSCSLGFAVIGGSIFYPRMTLPDLT